MCRNSLPDCSRKSLPDCDGYGLRDAVCRIDKDSAAAFGPGSDRASAADCRDLFVAAQVPQCRRVAGRHQFPALLKLYDFGFDPVFLPGPERDVRTLYFHALRTGVFLL